MLRAALLAAPHDPELLAEWGRLQLMAGSQELARQAFEKAAAMHPGLPAAELGLGGLELRAGEHQEAEARARAVQPLSWNLG